MSKPSFRRKECLVENVRPKQFFDLYCKVLHKPEESRPEAQMLIVTDFTSNKGLVTESPFVDRLGLAVKLDAAVVLTLWDNNAYCPHINEGCYLMIRNCRSKLDSTGRLEFVVNGDKGITKFNLVYPNKKLVHVIESDEEELQELREREYLYPGEEQADIREEDAILEMAKADILQPVAVPFTFPTILVPDVKVEQRRITKISELLDGSLKVPGSYRINAKVVDHMPFSISHFTRSSCTSCRKR